MRKSVTPFIARFARPWASFWLVALIIFFPLGDALAFDGFPSRAAVASQFQNVHFDQHIGSVLPLDAVFTDEYGVSHALKDYFQSSRPIILVFTYLKCPNLCSLILDGLVRALEPIKSQLGRTFDIVTLSIDPQEKPRLARGKRRSYLARLGLTEERSESWNFLTGDEPNIRRVADAAGFFYTRDKLSGDFLHPSGILIVSPQGKISQYFFGIQFDSQKVASAVNEARSEKTGTWVDQVLLYCFHYNPIKTKNGPAIMLGLRVAGLLSVAGIFILLVCL